MTCASTLFFSQGMGIIARLGLPNASFIEVILSRGEHSMSSQKTACWPYMGASAAEMHARACSMECLKVKGCVCIIESSALACAALVSMFSFSTWAAACENELSGQAVNPQMVSACSGEQTPARSRVGTNAVSVWGFGWMLVQMHAFFAQYSCGIPVCLHT